MQAFWMSDKLSPLEKEIASGKPTITLTYGDSMKPLLYHKSTRIVIVNLETNLKPNDLALYKRPSGQFVLHRIIKVDAEYYFTRGDNRYGMERVPKKWVLGVVTEIYRKNKHFSMNNKQYQLYVNLWNFIYPFRWCAYKIRAWMK